MKVIKIGDSHKMDMAWFDSAKSETAKKHKEAYTKSLKSIKPVKVHSGAYYYKGYEIANDGSREYPWNWGDPYDYDQDHYAERTFKDCINAIELM